MALAVKPPGATNKTLSPTVAVVVKKHPVATKTNNNNSVANTGSGGRDGIGSNASNSSSNINPLVNNGGSGQDGVGGESSGSNNNNNSVADTGGAGRDSSGGYNNNPLVNGGDVGRDGLGGEVSGSNNNNSNTKVKMNQISGVLFDAYSHLYIEGLSVVVEVLRQKVECIELVLKHA